LKGRPLYIKLRVSILPGHEQTWSRIVASMLDVTADRNAEQQMRAAMTEQEVLLHEIHHRVKNNMQVISSLLSLQSSYIRDPQTLELFGESQNRIRSMALIHEQLYRRQSFAKIDLREYLGNLTTVLMSAYANVTANVKIHVEADDVHLELDRAVPLGL